MPGVEFTNGVEPGVKLRAKKDSAMPEWLAWVLLPLVRGRAPFFANCTSLPLDSGMPILDSTMALCSDTFEVATGND
jgi:hypothetical protein